VRAAPPPRPPDVRRALPWREFEVGLDEAALHGRPILCLAEPHWSSAAQRLALVLGREDDTRALAERAFVPVLVDPIERPDVAARLRWASTALTGGAGPPLLALLTHRGAPFLTYGSLWPEGRPPYPSLRALLTSVAALYRERPDAVAAEAHALEARSRRGRGGRPRAEVRGPAPLWPALAPAIDPHFGGLRGLPKLPRAPLLWRLLDEAATTPSANTSSAPSTRCSGAAPSTSSAAGSTMARATSAGSCPTSRSSSPSTPPWRRCTPGRPGPSTDRTSPRRRAAPPTSPSRASTPT
jgi:hypothetical protein